MQGTSSRGLTSLGFIPYVETPEEKAENANGVQGGTRVDDFTGAPIGASADPIGLTLGQPSSDAPEAEKAAEPENKEAEAEGRPTRRAAAASKKSAAAASKRLTKKEREKQEAAAQEAARLALEEAEKAAAEEAKKAEDDDITSSFPSGWPRLGGSREEESNGPDESAVVASASNSADQALRLY